MSLVFVNQLGGIGDTGAQSTPITVISGLFLSAPDFQFDTFASFATEADWKTAIAAGELYPVQGILEEELQNFEDVVYESSTGKKAFQFEGQRGRMFKVLLPLEQHKILRSYSLKNWRAFYLDENNNLRGTSPDGTVVKGIRLGYFRVGKQDSATADSPAFTPIQIQESNVSEWDKNGIYTNPSWLASDLQGILTVQLTPSSVSSNSFTATVAYVDDSGLTAACAKTTIPVSGLVAANFRILNGTTLVTTGLTVTETAVLGTYTVAANTLVAGYTVQVVPNTANLYRSEIDTLAYWILKPCIITFKGYCQILMTLF